MQGSQQRRNDYVLIFDGPVSCSKLLGKLLSTHPELQPVHGYPYLLAASRGPEQTQARLTETTKQRLYQKWAKEVKQEDLERWSKMTFDQANADVKSRIEEIRSTGKIPIVQDHAAICIKDSISLPCLRGQGKEIESYAQQNPTNINESILLKGTPVILIRHPALVIPSFYRKQKAEEMLDLDDEAFQLWVNMTWIRIIYEYFVRKSKHPAVIDAQDLVHNTQRLAKKLGQLFGIDSDGFKETWEDSSNDPVPEGVVPSFHVRLRTSKGIERDTGALDENIDIEEKMKGWVQEFGAEITSEIRKRVDNEMPAYLYLRERKL